MTPEQRMFSYEPEEIPAVSESELIGLSMDSLQGHFINLYQRRNTVYLPDRISRINFLNVAVGDMQDAIRKDRPDDFMGDMVARTVSRVFCLANGINDVSLGSAMAEKYPITGCAYCHQMPCVCAQLRPEPILAKGDSSDQSAWSIKQWQKHLNSLYGQRNKEVGIVNTSNRLFKEIAELMNLEYSITRDRMGMNEVEHEYSLELADCLAWTMAVANYYDIDAEESIVKRYGKGCAKCLQNPCVCGPHDFKQARLEVN